MCTREHRARCDPPKNLPPAGLVKKDPVIVPDTFKIYSLNELARNTMIDLEKQESYAYTPPKPQFQLDQMDFVFHEEILKGRFQHFRERFFERLRSRRAIVGKIRKSNTVPPEITNDCMTFGIKSVPSPEAYGIILPNEKWKAVEDASNYFHDKHIISHNDYYPGEKINRNFNENFNPKACFGIKTTGDRNGIMVKQCLTHNMDTIVLRQLEAMHMHKTFGIIGKSLPGYAPKNRTYGIRTDQNNIDVQALIEGIYPSERNMELAEAVGHAHYLRHYILTKRDISIYDVRQLLSEDIESSHDLVPLYDLVEKTRTLNVPMCAKKMFMAMKHFGLLRHYNDVYYVEVSDFINFINAKHTFPPVRPVAKMTPNQIQRDTIYRDFCKDRHKKAIEEIKPKTRRYKYVDPYIDKAQDLIWPTPFVKLGMTPTEFEIPRSKDDQERIFKKVILKNFEEVWQRAIERHKPSDNLITVTQLFKMKEDIEEEKRIAEYIAKMKALEEKKRKPKIVAFKL